MPSSFRIDSSIWTSDWFMAASPREKTAFLWSWTNEHVTICGVYNPDFKSISKDLGFDVRKALRPAEVARSIFVLDDLGLIWITKFVKHQKFEGLSLMNAIKSLFNQTNDRRIIYAWLAVNRKSICANSGLIALLKQCHWRITQTEVTCIDDAGIVLERKIFADCSPTNIEPGQAGVPAVQSQPGAALECVDATPELDPGAENRVAPRRKGTKISVITPEKTSWPKGWTRELAVMIFDYWRETFKKSSRQKFTGERVRKFHARAAEGMTIVEAKLAILGCYIDGKTRWPDRLTNPIAHEFELIFRSNENVHNFIETASVRLREAGKKVSEDGTQLIPIND